MSGFGHNGGPALDDRLPSPPRGARCIDCLHWRRPRAQEVRWYEQRGNRPMREPRGHCDHVNLSGRVTAVRAFSARRDCDLACFAFTPAPPVYRPGTGGFVTISEGGRILWQGEEGALPDRFRQNALDL